MGALRRGGLDSRETKEQLPARSRSEMKGRFAGRYGLRSRHHQDESKGVLPIHEPPAKLKSRLRHKEVALPPGVLSRGYWATKHPVAAVRPATAMRRVLMIQSELREKEKRRLDAKRQRAEVEAGLRCAEEERAREARARAEETRAVIAVQVKEFEEMLHGILQFQQEQEEAARAKQKALRQIKPKASLAGSVLKKYAEATMDEGGHGDKVNDSAIRSEI